MGWLHAERHDFASNKSCWQVSTQARCPLKFCRHWKLSGSSHAMLEGGSSKSATPHCAVTTLNSSRLRLWVSRLSVTSACSLGDKFGTPCMHAGVRRALGPPGLSLRRLYCLHGGAKVSKLTMPNQHMRSESSSHASFKMSCSVFASRSKGSMPALSAAADMGARTPAKTLLWSVGMLACQGGGCARLDAAGAAGGALSPRLPKRQAPRPHKAEPAKKKGKGKGKGKGRNQWAASHNGKPICRRFQNDTCHTENCGMIVRDGASLQAVLCEAA